MASTQHQKDRLRLVTFCESSDMATIFEGSHEKMRPSVAVQHVMELVTATVKRVIEAWDTRRSGRCFSTYKTNFPDGFCQAGRRRLSKRWLKQL
jgi:hypothetical protein